MTVRTAQLCAVDVSSAGDNIVYTVPDGYTVIVKSVFVVNLAGGNIVDIGIQVAGVGIRHLLNYPSIPAGATEEWNGWFVMLPGDELIASGPYADYFVLASGTELFGIAPS